MSEMSEQLQLDKRVVNYRLENFVGIFKNAFTKEFCEGVIKHYEDMAVAGHGKTRFEFENAARTTKDDTQVFADEEYAALKDAGRHNNYSFKIQKTKIGGGYHIWHFESGNRECSNRLLTWILYLNDVQEGGETEFLYQHMRVKPEQGTIVIWPAAFTHTHRGNPPLSNEKYIVTGWTEF